MQRAAKALRAMDPQTSTEVLAVRHGETDFNKEHRQVMGAVVVGACGMGVDLRGTVLVLVCGRLYV